MPAGKTDRKTQQKQPVVLITAGSGSQQQGKSKSKQASKKQPATLSVHDVTVRDCLYWPADEQHVSKTSNDDVVYVSLRTQRQLKSDSSQQLHADADSHVPPPAAPLDDGTVSDAMRGWPHYQRQCEEAAAAAAEAQRASDEQRTAASAERKPKTKSKSTSGTKAGKSQTKRGGITQQEDEDIHVPDLISQRFLHEYMAQREAELERERKKTEARERAAREGRRAAKDRTDIKANKAAQLRSIALADRVEQSAFDLWKMDKFTRSARPHVSSFRTGQGSAGDQSGSGRATGAGRGGRRSGEGIYTGRSYSSQSDEFTGGAAAACTCPDAAPYFDDGDAYYYEQDCQYNNGRLTADDDINHASVYFAASPSPISAL